MTVLKSFKGENCAFSWCPCDGKTNIIAVASKEGSISGFDENKGTLHIVDFDVFGSSEPHPLVSAELENRVNCLIWGKTLPGNESYPFGIIATSYNNGTICIWRPVLCEDNYQLHLVQKISVSNSPVKAMCFNNYVFCRQIACGCQDGSLFVVELVDDDEPTITPLSSPSHTPCEITKLTWNPKVSYILSAIQTNGHITLWDLNKKDLWTELCDPNSMRLSDMIWDPADGLKMVVAVENDNHPAIRIWDLRVSTASPISELTGHHKGVLGLSWCPFDDSFLLSCGKDNRVLLWDVKSCSLIEEVEGSAEEQAAPQDATMFFTSMSAASATRKTQIDWCPVYPGLACASSTDRTLTIYNLQAPGAKTLRRAPKWIERPCGVSFGFGGKLVMFNGTSKHVGIAQLTPDQHLIEESKDFDEAMSTGDMKSLCMKRCDTEQNPAYRDMWNFMKCMFNADARDSLVQYLGYNQAVESEEEFKPLEVHEEVEEEEPAPEEETKAPEQFDGIGFSPSIDSLANAMFSQPPPAISAEELFSKPLDNLPLSTPPAMTLPTPSSPIGSIMSGVSNVPIAPSTPKESVLSESSSAKEVLDPTWVADVRMAIICGNFERAVDLCFDNHRYGDALLISSWGEPELLNQTQLRYMNEVFPSELRCFNSIVRGDLSTYVQNSRLEDWRDTLVLILTYGKTEEFIQLCQQLSTKLEENYFVNEALLCSICAMDLPSVIRLGLKFNINKDIDELVPVLEVICILNHMQEESGESLPELPSNLVHNVITLCTSLVDQGLVSMATRFIRAIGKSDEGELLLYRIYQCYPEALNGYVPRPPLETPRAPEVRPVATVPQASRFSAAAPMNRYPPSMVPTAPMPAPMPSAPMMPSAPIPSAPVMPSAPMPAAPVMPSAPAMPTIQKETAPTHTRSMALPTHPKKPYIPTQTLQPIQPAPQPIQPTPPTQFTPMPASISSAPAAPVAPAAPQVRAPNPMDTLKVRNNHYVPTRTFAPSQPLNPIAPLPQPEESNEVEPTPEPEPVIRELTSDEQTILEAINETIDFLQQVPLSATQKPIVTNMISAVAIMKDQFTHSEVSEDATQLLMTIAQNLKSYQYNDAFNVYKKLNQEYWKDHKDWLLSFRHFLMLCVKMVSN